MDKTPNIKFTQSLVKDFERSDRCNTKWKAKWVDKDPRLSISNEFTERGKFFEQIVLGSSAHENNPVVDLPRLKNGEKSAIQTRIEQQAEFAKTYINGGNPLHLTLYKSQIHIQDGDDEGTLDAVLIDKQGVHWVIDLKLTSDVESTRTKYGYGNDWSEMDQLQLAHYGKLYQKQYNVIPRLALFVFDYSPRMGYNVSELVLSTGKLEERDHRFNAAKSFVKNAMQYLDNWGFTPSENECKNCPLECKFRYK